jgi:hypothetical protein
VRRENVRNVSLKPFTQVFQVTRLTDPGQAVRTRTGDYSELQALARDIFHGNRQISTEDQIRLTAIPAPKPQPQAMLMSLP